MVPTYKAIGYVYCSACHGMIGPAHRDAEEAHEAADCVVKMATEQSYLWDRIGELEDRLNKLESDK